jgi:hypothetical protein
MLPEIIVRDLKNRNCLELYFKGTFNVKSSLDPSKPESFQERVFEGVWGNFVSKKFP